MKGSVTLDVIGLRDIFNITLRRSFSYILGDSGTGKTLLADLIRRYIDGYEDVSVSCSVTVEVINSVRDIRVIDETSNSLYILDEDTCKALREIESNSKYLKLLQQKLYKKSDGAYPNAYFLFMTRSPLLNSDLVEYDTFVLKSRTTSYTTTRYLYNG